MLRQKSRRYHGYGSYVPLKMQATSRFSSKPNNKFILQQIHFELCLRKVYVQIPDLISIPVPYVRLQFILKYCYPTSKYPTVFCNCLKYWYNTRMYRSILPLNIAVKYPNTQQFYCNCLLLINISNPEELSSIPPCAFFLFS